MRIISRSTACELLSKLQLATMEDNAFREHLWETGLLAREEEYNIVLEGALLVELRRDLKGVTNTFLEQELNKHGIVLKVVGAIIDLLVECPCCHSYSLLERAQHDICLVCKWQDDGTLEEGDYSSPNRQTLGKGRTNFKAFGACDQNALKSTSGISFLERYPIRDLSKEL
ncbi:MAG: CPCC family cysteine-rich protein [Aureispira sp.]